MKTYNIDPIRYNSNEKCKYSIPVFYGMARATQRKCKDVITRKERWRTADIQEENKHGSGR